jgi:transposase
VDEGGRLAPPPPGGPGRAGQPGADRLVEGDRGRRLRPRQKGGALTGPSPVDRGKPGSKIHVLADRNGLPLSVAASAANVNDADALKALVRAVPAVRSRRGPRRREPDKLHADKAYDHAGLRKWLRERGIAARIARKGIESSEKLGRHRWVIERTMAWLTGYRRLTLRYERNASHFLAFITLAATLTCYKKLTKLTT